MLCDFGKLCELSEPCIPHLKNGIKNSIYIMRIKESMFVKCLSFDSLQCLFITLLIMCKAACGYCFCSCYSCFQLALLKTTFTLFLRPSTVSSRFPLLPARYYLLSFIPVKKFGGICDSIWILLCVRF